MNTFLELVAKDLFGKLQGNMENITIVFPNKRASLFFNKALVDLIDKPLWSPQYTTISELFRAHSQLQLGDNIQLVCELYKSYIKITKSNETLDHFYGWGELIIKDFDDIDKHRADAKKIFSLLSDIHELDGVDYLTEKQQEVLHRFFKNFTLEHNTELKQRFLKLWNKLGDLYDDFKHRLTEQGIAYEGMLYRNVVEQQEKKSDKEFLKDNRIYVFVGFNLLHEVEISLFSFFQQNKKALFYWDYDHYYMNGHEAGKYISQYMKLFPNELTNIDGAYNNFRKKEDVTFISSPTEDLQARYIVQWLTPERINAGRKTAIVLADESLLDTVLHCLPEQVKSVNITTGYPLEKTTVASFVRIMITLLQRRTYTLHNVNAILRHPLTKCISKHVIQLHQELNNNTIYYPALDDLALDDNLRQLLEPVASLKDCKELNSRLMWAIRHIAMGLSDKEDFVREALYRMYSILNRIDNLSSAQWSPTLYQSILQQIIQSTSIPFHGEPIEGIQIMGILETRNLDFEHLLLLSCNEGKIPGKMNDSSFIPHSVRAGYGLTTIDNKVAIYAYYFHRLMQRAHDIHILYNNTPDLGQSGEMSRFMLQLIADAPFQIKRGTLIAEQETEMYRPQDKPKSSDMIKGLLERAYFSPSALGLYLRCPLKFYYKYVANIKDNNESDEEEMDVRAFGNIFHKAAELLYQPFVGKTITASYIDDLLKEKGNITIQRYVDSAFRSELFMIKDEKRKMPKLNGLQTINREMIITFLKNMLLYDKRYTPFVIRATETPVYAKIALTIEDNLYEITIGGTVDRQDIYVDEDGFKRIRVIDYKTGRKKMAFNMPALEDIFSEEHIKQHADYYLQAMMYSSIISDNVDLPVKPCLVYVQHATSDDSTADIAINKQPINDIREYLPEFNINVKELIQGILNKNMPFKPTKDRKRCEECIYATFCC